MDVMIDLETLGTDVEAPIVQIAALVFEPVHRGKVRNGAQSFNCLVKPDDAIQRGARPSMNTINWWMDQPKETRDRVFNWDHPSNTQVLKGSTFEALQLLVRWLPEANQIEWEDIGGIWCQGTHFDIAKLEWSFKLFGMKEPWHFRAPSDLRTALKLKGGWPSDLDTTGLIPHYAPDDCVMQAMALQKALGKT